MKLFTNIIIHIHLKRYLIFIFTLLLGSCGGGGGSSDPNQPMSFTLGGNISNLFGSGLIIQNNGSDNLSISSDGNYTLTKSEDELDDKIN